MVPESVLHRLSSHASHMRLRPGICLYSALKRLKSLVKKQYQYKLFFRTDLVTIFSITRRLINQIILFILLEAVCDGKHQRLVKKLINTLLFIAIKVDNIWRTASQPSMTEKATVKTRL